MSNKVSKAISLITTCVFVLLTTASSLAQENIFSDLPDLGASSDALMTPAEEQRLGKAFMRSVRRSMDVMNTPILVEYIDRIGYRIIDAQPDTHQAFRFFVINNHQINAFAGPAGHIGINSGLITNTSNEDELAAVMAHEIAHVTQRHLIRAWEDTKNMALPNAALILAGVLLGASVNPDAGIAAVMGGQASSVQQRINFTRANEKEADRVGMTYLVNAGYMAEAMPDFFERLGRLNMSFSDIPELLMTHPVTNSRIADSLSRIHNFPKVKPNTSMEYLLIKTHIDVSQQPSPEEAVARYALAVDDQRNKNIDIDRYGLAISYIQNREYSKALKILKSLINKYPNQNAIIIALAKTELNLKQSTNAIERLSSALQNNPQSYALNIELIEVLIQSHQLAKAQNIFDNFSEGVSRHPILYKLSAQIAGANGQIRDSHEHMAKYYYANGQLEEAITQLELALKVPGINYYNSSRIEAKLDVYKEELEITDKRPERL